MLDSAACLPGDGQNKKTPMPIDLKSCLFHTSEGEFSAQECPKHSPTLQDGDFFTLCPSLPQVPKSSKNRPGSTWYCEPPFQRGTSLPASILRKALPPTNAPRKRNKSVAWAQKVDCWNYEEHASNAADSRSYVVKRSSASLLFTSTNDSGSTPSFAVKMRQLVRSCSRRGAIAPTHYE
jgi:hypothetical protein